MPDLLLTRVGRTLLPANAAAEKALFMLPERRPMRSTVRLRRSLPAHNLFFAAIAAAVEHWPRGHEPEPDGDAEFLRAWLLCKVGHAEKEDYPLSGDNPRFNQIIVASIQNRIDRARAAGEYLFRREGEVKTADGELIPVIRVFTSRTINHDDMDESTFAPIRQRVFDLIEAIVGATINDLVQEAA